MCDHGFGDHEAQVICSYITRKLDYIHNAAIPFRGAIFGEGSGPIFLENLECSGTESSLLGCGLGSPVGIHSCDHSQDSGVMCTGKLF